MKRRTLRFLAGGTLIGGLLLTSGVVAASTHRASMSNAWSHSGDVGPGLMGSYGHNGMMARQQQTIGSASALTIDGAQHRVQLYMKQFGNPYLKIDEIMEFQRNFYAIVKDTSTGHGAFEVLIDKWSGLVFPEYGPAMMWNTKYGMMRGSMMGYRYPSGPMTVSPAQAASIARQWLRKYRPGTAVEAPDQFPGYYTVHFRKNGTIAGMLSVNGYSGRVWYHSWHGAFISMKTG